MENKFYFAIIKRLKSIETDVKEIKDILNIRNKSDFKDLKSDQKISNIQKSPCENLTEEKFSNKINMKSEDIKKAIEHNQKIYNKYNHEQEERSPEEQSKIDKISEKTRAFLRKLKWEIKEQEEKEEQKNGV